MFITPATVFLTVCLANAAAAFPAQFTKRQQAQVITSCTVPNTAALTFDDGPYIYQPEIIDALNAAGAKGTFFLNGDNWSCIYDDNNVQSIQKAYNDGHQIASHTWAHKDLATLGQSDLESEIDRTTQAIERITGATPAFMRPPYGSYNDLVQSVAGSKGFSLVNWDFDSGDSTGSTPQQSEDAYTQLASQHPPTILALNHETSQTTAEQVLPFALKTLKAQGYKFVTVAECLGLSPYQKTGSPQAKDSSWTCDASGSSDPTDDSSDSTDDSSDSTDDGSGDDSSDPTDDSSDDTDGSSDDTDDSSDNTDDSSDNSDDSSDNTDDSSDDSSDPTDDSSDDSSE